MTSRLHHPNCSVSSSFLVTLVITLFVAVGHASAAPFDVDYPAARSLDIDSASRVRLGTGDLRGSTLAEQWLAEWDRLGSHPSEPGTVVFLTIGLIGLTVLSSKKHAESSRSSAR